MNLNEKLLLPESPGIGENKELEYWNVGMLEE